MGTPPGIRTRPWWIAITAVAGLLLAIVAAGVVGLVLNQQVKQVTDNALRYDVELEDEGDDLRVAILDVRHYHRNVTFAGPSLDAVADFEGAYAALLEEIGELQLLGIRDPDVPQPDQIREMAQQYYADFRPAVDLYELDPAAFARASNLGLDRLEALDRTAQVIDRLGERRATTALESVDRAATTAGVVLLSAIGGLVVVGATLAYAAVRVVGELSRLYADQQALAAALARASQAKTDFIADVSHELRTPLTVLRGNAEVGLELERNCVHEEMLAGIVTESARMARMLEDLLLLARSDSASLPLEPETVAVAPFLEGLATRAEILVRERGASFRAALTGAGQVRIDPARIEQAVLILVDNAAKYSPPGELVTLTSTTASGQLRIEITDRGPGIPEAELPRVFERFYRVDKTRTWKQGGAGLGLSIAKTIVEAHDGRIDAASRVGEGTRMSLELPLLSPARPAGQLVGAAIQGEPP
jgi:two-component system, OmpR family, sensor histidine kinase VicK